MRADQPAPRWTPSCVASLAPGPAITRPRRVVGTKRRTPARQQSVANGAKRASCAKETFSIKINKLPPSPATSRARESARSNGGQFFGYEKNFLIDLSRLINYVLHQSRS